MWYGGHVGNLREGLRLKWIMTGPYLSMYFEPCAVCRVCVCVCRVCVCVQNVNDEIVDNIGNILTNVENYEKNKQPSMIMIKRLSFNFLVVCSTVFNNFQYCSIFVQHESIIFNIFKLFNIINCFDQNLNFHEQY